MNLHKKINSGLSWVLSILFLIAVLFEVFWLLNKGMVFSDEAFFILHTIPGFAKSGLTYWYILYSPFIFDNYLITNYLLVIFSVLSAFLMGYATTSFLKFSVSPILVGFWCILAQFILYSPTVISTNHSSINYLIFNCIIASLSFFLLYKKNFFLLLVGFFFTSLIFVFLTSTIFIIPLLIFLFLNNKKEFWNQIIWIGLGSLMMFSIYFIFLQTPQEFISGIVKAIELLKHDDTHGSSGLIIWHKKIIAKLLMILPLILIFSIKSFRRYWLTIIFLIVSLLFIFYIIYPGFVHRSAMIPTFSFYFLAIIILIKSFNNKISIKFYYALLILILPYFASFGTDMDLFIKSTFYFPFILVPSLYLALQLKTKVGNLLSISFIAIIMIAIVVFFTYPFRYTWDKEYKPIEQNIGYEFRGATINFDNEKIRKLNEAKPFITGEDYILVSDPKLWGYVLILGGKPPLLYYKFNDYVLQYIEENNVSKQKLIFLEDHQNPFKKELIQKFIGDEFILKKIKLSDFDVYSVETCDSF